MKTNRINSLMPDGIPKYVRCYDNNGETFDRYTIVFTGHYRKIQRGFDYVGASENPCHPQGFYQHGWSENPIDRPKYAHLGKHIQFNALPEYVQRAVIIDYKEVWDL